MSGFALEADARLALDVATGMAAASGDEHCGTEHLLFGIVATADGEVAELAELFALDAMRVERGVRTLRIHHCHPDNFTDDPPLSTRAELALYSTPMSGAGSLASFDVLVACIADPRSGASTVLRSLGVRIGEIRRLAELGAARLEQHEVAGLIAALDRRREEHLPWWGPAADAPVVRVPLGDGDRRLLGRSDTAVATLDGLVAGPDGYGITVTIASCDHWVLPPRWEPEEELLPGIGSIHRNAPDVVTIDLRDGADRVVTNRTPRPRWRGDQPTPGSMIRLGNRSVVDDRNDRRFPARRAETSEWWVWPLPSVGPLELRFEWPAEAIAGVVDLDAEEINLRAASLRERS